jgi:uncharacterized membrane-anchored protein YhcB (DUF1043 family)
MEHNVTARSKTVFAALDQASIPVCPKLIIASNRIDRDLTRALLYAEKTCRQPDRPPWSVALHLASKAVRFWKTFISGARNATDVSYPLSMICADLQWDTIPTLDLPAAKVELNQAQKDLQECRAHAAENRQQFLSDMADSAALANDLSREKALKRQLHVEAMKSCYRKLKSALRPNGLHGGITKVEVLVNGTLVAYTDKTDVHRECLHRNRQHFNQAAGTPWTIYPLSEIGTKATPFKVDTMPDAGRQHGPNACRHVSRDKHYPRTASVSQKFPTSPTSVQKSLSKISSRLFTSGTKIRAPPPRVAT